jgi:hypothetical protein
VVGINLPGGVEGALAQGLIEPFAGLPDAYTVSDFGRFNDAAIFGLAR